MLWLSSLQSGSEIAAFRVTLQRESCEAEEQQVYAQFLEAVQALSDEDFTDPRRFRKMPEQWLLWRILAGCSFAHYRQHIPSIRAWLSLAQRREEGDRKGRPYAVRPLGTVETVETYLYL